MHRRSLLAAPVLGWALAGAAAAEDFPTRPVRVVVPFPPGGGIDVLIRAVAAELQLRWGQPVVVENRVGAGGNIGTEAAARARPDGYTLLATVNQTFTTNRHLFRTLPYDPDTDFQPISLMVQSDHMLLAHPSVAAADVGELVAEARRRPGAFTYGSFGNGSQPQLVYEALNQRERLDILHVPYQGIAPLLIAVTRGEVMLATGSAAVAGELVRSGRLKALAMAGQRRSAAMPDLPTTAEQGYPYLQASIWYGLFAPARMPADIAAKIGAEVRAILAAPAFAAQQVLGRGLDLVAGGPEELALAIREESAAVGTILRAARIEPQ